MGRLPGIRVRRFGALGDGRTDDTASIRRAIAELGKRVASWPVARRLRCVRPARSSGSAAWHIRGARPHDHPTPRWRVGRCGRPVPLQSRPCAASLRCSIEDLTIDAAGLPGTVVYLDGLSLFGMRGVSIIKAAGSALSWWGFSILFRGRFSRACGTRAARCLHAPRHLPPAAIR